MTYFLSYYSGLLPDALTIGAIVGVLAGVILFTASSAGEGVHRVLIGVLAGGIIMGLFQAVVIANAAGVGGNGSLNPLFQSRVDSFGGVVYRGIVLTVQAAFAGGLFMIVSLAPLRAFKGALAGLIIGSVSAVLAWGLLQFIDTAIPIVIFYVLVLGLVLFIIENLPRRA